MPYVYALKNKKPHHIIIDRARKSFFTFYSGRTIIQFLTQTIYCLENTLIPNTVKVYIIMDIMQQ